MSNNLFKELINTFKFAKKEYLVKLFTSILIRGILLVIPILYSESIDYISEGNYKMAILFFIVSIIITLMYRFSEGANQYTYYALYNKLSNHYTKLAISKTNDNSIFSLSRFDLGQYTNTVVSDVDVICTFLASLVIRLVQILEFIIIFIYFYSLNTYIFLSVVVLSVVMIFIAVKSGNKVQKLNASRKSSLDLLTSSIHEYFLGIKEIKGFNLYEGIAPSVYKKSSKYLKDNAEYNIVYQNTNQVYLFIFELFRLITMIYGVYLISTGNLLIGTLLLIYNYYQKIIDNYSTVLTINVEVRNMNVSINRFFKIVEYSKQKKNEETRPFINIEGNIKFNNILYGYKDNPLLNKVSFKVPAKSLTVITGESGSGKSGIFELLLKLNRQHEGEIYLDKHLISEYSNDDYFNMVSSATKTSMFFKMSIKDNLSFVSDDVEYTLKICKEVGVHNMIMALKDGYDTIIDNNNINEQFRQLLAIARVFIKNSKIILFDEVLSGLDREYRKKITKILEEKKKHHTIIIISHDDKVLDIADKIILLHDHKAYECNNYEEYEKRLSKFKNK